MELLSEYLESYEGRDKFIGILSYTAKLATILPLSDSTMNKKLRIFGRQMSNCRVIYRLLDDIPALHYAIKYGWGEKESDRVIRWLELLSRWTDVISSPVETISWLGEHKLISVNDDKWDNISTWLWIISINLTLLKSLRHYSKLVHYKNKKVDKESSSVKKYNCMIKNELIKCTRSVLDLSYAVNYLPKGTLWGGQLLTWQVGALGVLSSSIGLYQTLSRRASRKST
ncbi:peroxisomal membrane protein 11C [Chelonus insularis]|uniref:peroxisomal membrane protein 11C n=1 Tax=Chelonus insularis TaxID=460826 RepID=UPI00158DB0BD|nr:peroxisomal membrane protein 11C [Chelonus insularis]XP_034935942.1 peroxisomal membrane protein 11C [Chelonus insularis]